jgi:hypothetical protein
MEAPSSTYLYTIALIAITFVGFTAIVMILRQSLGGPLSRYDTLVARFFMGWGFSVTFAAMLPPLLGLFEMAQPLSWRIASLALGLLLLALSIGYPLLRRRATGERPSAFVLAQSAAGGVIAIILLVNAAVALPHAFPAAIYCAVLTFTLAQASGGFIVTLNVILAGTERRSSPGMTTS